MSGFYFVQKTEYSDFHKTAGLISAQLSYEGEKINHYGISGQILMGMVSPDKFSHGIMPRYYKEDNLWGLFSGKLYDCDYNKELFKEFPSAANDLDLIKHLYINKRIEKHLPDMNGAFSFILWDASKEILIAGNDRYGLYPMYWSQSKNGFCLSSRVLASVLSGVVEGNWNPDGVIQLITVDDVISDTTLVSGVHTFPQASLMIKTKAGLEWKAYWQYNYTGREQKMDRVELADELGRCFTKAVKLQSAGKRRIGVTLSGGLDSRTIVAGAEKSGITLHTFTWGKSNSYDRRFAKGVAELYRTTHHDSDYMYKNFETGYEAGIRATEGHINYFDCHMLAHLEIMREHTDVILNGYAGDLVLGGSYLRPAWMRDIPIEKLAQILFKWRNTNFPESGLHQAISCFDEITKEQLTSGYYMKLINKKKGMRPPDIVDSFFLENRVRRQCSMGTVLMRYVVESAAPFFEYDLLDLTTSIPADLRYEHRMYLSMINKHFPESLSVRWQKTLLPASFPLWMNLPAKAFLKGCRILEGKLGWPEIASRQSPVDFAVWLRGPLKNWLEQIIYDKNPVAREVLRKDFCEDVFKKHLNNGDFTRLLGVIISICGFAYALKKARDKVVAQESRAEEIRIK